MRIGLILAVLLLGGLCAGRLVWSDPAGNEAGVPSVPAATMLPRESSAPVTRHTLRVPARSSHLPGVPHGMLRYIDSRFAGSTTLRMTMTQLAQGWAAAVDSARDPASARLAGEQISTAIACAMSARVLQRHGGDARAMLDEILLARSQMLADASRLTAYDTFQHFAAGQYFSQPAGEPCQFDPALLPD